MHYNVVNIQARDRKYSKNCGNHNNFLKKQKSLYQNLIHKKICRFSLFNTKSTKRVLILVCASPNLSDHTHVSVTMYYSVVNIQARVRKYLKKIGNHD